jgi:hypothetical protein
MRRTTVVLALALAVCAAVSSAPARAKTTNTPVTAGVKGLDISPQELRLRVRALIRPTLGTVEAAADRIIDGSNDPKVRRGAVIWKIETTTTFLSAMLRNDPLLALSDAWGYAIQVEAYLARPQMAVTYGAATADASAAMVTIQNRFREFAGHVGEGFSGEKLEATVRAWADANPIEGALYQRPSMDSAVAHVLATATSAGAMTVLANLDETTADVTKRMDLYTMYLPRLARWEAELAIDDLAKGVDAGALTAEVERFTRAADRIAAAAESAPQLVAGERAAAIEAVGKERRAVIDAVRDERIATLHEIELIAQRLVDRSGGPLHDTMRQDMEEFVQSVEAMRKRLIVDAGSTLNDVVDHAFWRAVQLLLIGAGLGFLGLVVYARFLRR